MNAHAILQDYLDRLSTAVLEGDFDTYADGVALPFTLVTAQKALVIDTSQDLQDGFDAYHNMLKSQNATDMIRIVERAERRSETQIAGRYSTNILAVGNRIFDPFQSDMILENQAGDWRAIWISNDMRDARWPIHVPALDGKDGA